MSTQNAGPSTRQDGAFIGADDVLEIVRSLNRQVPAVSQLLDGVGGAAMAARSERDAEVLNCLKEAIADPIARLIADQLPIITAQLPLVVRKAIGEGLGAKLPELLTTALRQKLNDELIQHIVAQTLNQHLEAFDRNSSEIVELKNTVGQLTYQLQQLLSNAEDATIPAFAPPGSLLNRYYQQAPEKAELGRYTAATFLRQPTRSFVMASSTTIHLAQQIRRSAVPGGCFFFTNSVAFPLALLGERPQHQANVFCAQVFDHECGGWLPNIADPPTEHSLRSLFMPNSWALTTAFLVPRKLAVRDGMYFLRAEASRMATILAESAHRLVLMVTADRLCDELEDRERSGSFPENGQWGSLNKPVSLVVSGVRSDEAIVRLVNDFCARHVDVHYQDPATGDWRIATPSNASDGPSITNT